jgi:hypothetical protein
MAFFAEDRNKIVRSCYQEEQEPEKRLPEDIFYGMEVRSRTAGTSADHWLSCFQKDGQLMGYFLTLRA